MPDKTEDNKTMKVAESRTTTLVLAENDKVYYYTGTENPEVKLTNFSESGLRKVLREKVNTVKDPIVIIKAKKESRYKNMVDVIDEMAITGVKIYALVDITPADLELLEKAPY